LEFVARGLQPGKWAVIDGTLVKTERIAVNCGGLSVKIEVACKEVDLVVLQFAN
jgi:hypothetical protein